MTARLRKEARALLPYAAASWFLVLVHYVGQRNEELSWVSFALGCAMIGGASIGLEFHHRTLPLLLTQPIARSAIWRDKMIALAVALATTSALFFVLEAAWGSASRLELTLLAFAPLGVFGAAPLFSLLTRGAVGGTILSLGGAFWAVPLLQLGHPRVVLALVPVYCALAYALGYRRFLTFQVRDSTALSLKAPDWRWPGAASKQPFVTLLRKELRLQQGTFVVAAGLYAVSAMVALGIHLWGGQEEHKRIGSVLFVVYWSVLPLVAGALAVGEERGLGVDESQLTLPPSAGQQWLAKMIVTLPISLILGFVIPLAIDQPGYSGRTLATLTIGYVVLIHVALYAGTLARDSFRAILVALGILVVAWLLAAVTLPLSFHRFTHPVLVGLVLSLGVFQRLAFTNFRRRGLGTVRLGLQALVLGSVVIGACLL